MNRWTILVRSVAALVVGLVVIVLAGYALHLQAIVDVAPGLKGMSPITAIGLLGLGVAIFMESLSLSAPSKFMAWIVLILSAAMLAAQIAGGADFVSPIVAGTVFGYDPGLAGRTSPATAGCLLILSIALLNRARPLVADGAAAAALLISGTAVIGYFYGVSDLYALPIFNTMAIHTALAVMLLSFSSMMVRPDVGWAAVVASKGAGGGATRRQLAFIALPPIAGGLLLAATNSRHLGPGAAMALLVVMTVAPLAFLILRDGAILNALENEQEGRARLQANQAAELKDKLSEQATRLAVESAERVKAEEAMFRAQRMETVGQLTGGIAHDFNNLLMAIGGNLQLLSSKLSPTDPARRYVDNAALAVDKGSRLTGQLLTFSRTQKLEIRPVEIDEALRGARRLLGNALGPTIDIELRLDASQGWAATDPDQLELAILNLALNARDAMPRGGRLTIESGAVDGPPTGARPDAQFLAIRLIDIGEGMSADVARQAVEPFFTTKERGKGTGLGLAQVYGFVAQCGGDLRITSQLGSGTTIELILPRVAPPLSAAERFDRSIPAKSVSGDGRLVLVIDDDASVRGVLVEILKTAGFRVVEAESGAQGLKTLETMTPVAAVIDFFMPGMNGAEVARHAQTLVPKLPIVFVSGYYDTVALDGIAPAVVLRKPFDVDGLKHAVAQALH